MNSNSAQCNSENLFNYFYRVMRCGIQLWRSADGKLNQIHLLVSPTLSPEVRCPPIVTLKNILLAPPACGKRAASPGSACLLTCRQGYTLQGNRKAVCLGSGNWTANVHKAVCTGNWVFLERKFIFSLLWSEVRASCRCVVGSGRGCEIWWGQRSTFGSVEVR